MLVPKKAIEIFSDGGTVADVIRANVLTKHGTPVSIRRCQEWKQAYRNGEAEPYEESDEIVLKTTIVESGDKATVQFTTDRITTLDQLLKACEVDLDTWEVEKCEINKYEMGRKHTLKSLEFNEGKISGYLEDSGTLSIQPMVSVKVWLKRRPEKIFEEVIEQAIERLKNYSPVYTSSYVPQTKRGFLFSPQFYDPHFNNLSVDESHTVVKAADEFKHTVDLMVSKAQTFGMNIDRVLLPIGHDALHSDNLQGTTTKGTQQELAGNQRTAVDYMCQAYVHLIERFAEIAPVDVEIVPGNHDRFVTYFLGKYLEVWFRQHSDVSVDSSQGSRKYYRYGKTMICMEHGDRISPRDMIGVMATESPEYFSSTTWREVWRGHLHTDKTLFSPITEQYGVTVRYMPALAKTNEWHSLMGYVGNHRAAEGMFYHISEGPAGIFPIFLD